MICIDLVRALWQGRRLSALHSFVALFLQYTLALIRRPALEIGALVSNTLCDGVCCIEPVSPLSQ